MEMTVKLNVEELELLDMALCFAYCDGEGWMFNKDNKETKQNEITTLANKLRESRVSRVALDVVEMKRTDSDGRKWGYTRSLSAYRRGCTVYYNEELKRFATLDNWKGYNSNEWVCDLGNGEDKVYKTERGAKAYLEKSGYKRVELFGNEDVTYIYRESDIHKKQ